MPLKKYLCLGMILMFSGIVSAQPKGLNKGDHAPLFSAASGNAGVVNLSATLKKGPVVLFFYRGSWCPYCNKQMADLLDSIKFLKDKGAAVIGITPETNESMKKIITKSGAGFPLIHDENYTIMNNYGVSFKVDSATVQRYKSFNIHLDLSNGNTDYVLPVPATYIIDKNGLIQFVYFNTDYRNRVTVAELLKHL